jgi:hypothetical protein
MNPLIKNRLPADYQLLWQLTKKQRLSGDLGAMIQNQIKQVRKNFRTSKKDLLVEKYLNFGNDGLWSTQKLRELAASIYENKKPGNLNLGEWISVELELVMPSEKCETDFLRFVRKNGFANCVTIKNDGSIRTISPRRTAESEQRRSAGDMARELLSRNPVPDSGLRQEQEQMRSAFGREIIITFRYGDWKFVKTICGELNRLKCFVNSSCGLHVHFDCRHVEPDDVVRIGKRIAYTVPALKEILPPSRQDNRFCAIPINEMGGGDNRYAFVNLQSYNRHQTIEIRGHNGTTDAVKVVNWIRILKAIMEKRSRKTVESVSELITAFKLDADLVEYINARYTKFHTPMELSDAQRHLDDVELDDASLAAAPDEVMNMQPVQEAVVEVPLAQTGTDAIAAAIGEISDLSDVDAASAIESLRRMAGLNMTRRQMPATYTVAVNAPGYYGAPENSHTPSTDASSWESDDSEDDGT